METETKNLGGGIGFGGLLGLMFIAFKLLGVITWSWWWVLAPLWIPAVAIIFILISVLFAMCIFAVCKK